MVRWGTFWNIFLKILTFNIDDKLLSLYLKTLFSAGSDFAHPRSGISQIQICHSDCAIEIGILAQPLNPASLNVDAFTYNVGVQVRCFPPTQVDLPVSWAVKNNIIADLLPRCLTLMKSGRWTCNFKAFVITIPELWNVAQKVRSKSVKNVLFTYQVQIGRNYNLKQLKNKVTRIFQNFILYIENSL